MCGGFVVYTQDPFARVGTILPHYICDILYYMLKHYYLVELHSRVITFSYEYRMMGSIAI